MHHWYLVHPEYRSYLDQALRGRVEAQGRAVYLAILGVEAVAGFLARGLRRGARAIARGLRRAVCALAQWQRRRQTVRALSRLDARMLRDVGIYPGDIEWVAAELAHDRTPGSADRPPTRPPLVPRLRLDLECPEMRFAA